MSRWLQFVAIRLECCLSRLFPNHHWQGEQGAGSDPAEIHGGQALRGLLVINQPSLLRENETPAPQSIVPQSIVPQCTIAQCTIARRSIAQCTIAQRTIAQCTIARRTIARPRIPMDSWWSYSHNSGTEACSKQVYQTLKEAGTTVATL